jgi:ribulose-bisphosphate carboxylase large chain
LSCRVWRNTKAASKRVRIALSWLMTTSLEVLRVIGASGIHVRTMCFGKMEGGDSDKSASCIRERGGWSLLPPGVGRHAADDVYHLERHERVALDGFLVDLGRSDVLTIAGGGAFGHKDGPKQGAISCGQGEDAWML